VTRVAPRRAELLAYLVGAGVAGTLIVVPFTGRAIVTSIWPRLAPLTYVPFFLIPPAWGLWNWLRVRRRSRLGVGTWGAVLGFVLAAAVNVLFVVDGRWFTALLLLLVTLPAGYYLLWLLLVGPLNVALEVDTEPVTGPGRS
jgi:hypothetical protein